MNALFAGGFLACKRIGHYLVMADVDETGEPRSTSWGTPAMFGNNARAPLWPYQPAPYQDDIEESVLFARKANKRDT